MCSIKNLKKKTTNPILKFQNISSHLEKMVKVTQTLDQFDLYDANFFLLPNHLISLKLKRESSTQ